MTTYKTKLENYIQTCTVGQLAFLEDQIDILIETHSKRQTLTKLIDTGLTEEDCKALVEGVVNFGSSK